MDKINARIQLNTNNSIALLDLKAMNKKFAFTVVQKTPRKMAKIEVSRILDAMFVTGNFQVAKELIIKFYGKNIPLANKPISNYQQSMAFQ